MSEWFVLIGIAFAFYLIECVVWLSSETTVCYPSPIVGRWKCATGLELPGNERGGLAFIDPLSLCGATVASRWWPISISPNGITNITSNPGKADEPARYISFDEILHIDADFDSVRINHDLVIHVGCSPLSLYLADTLRSISVLALGQRAAAIEKAVAQTADRESAIGVWSEFQRRTRKLQILCRTLFVYLFGLVPLVVFVIGPYPSWRWLLGGLATLTVLIAVMSHQIHSELYPECSYDRWTSTLGMVLLPIAGIRAVDKLSRNAFWRYNPVIVVAAMCGPAGATPLIRRHVIDLAQDVSTRAEADRPSSVRDCVEWFRVVLVREVSSALLSASVVISEPPSRSDASMMVYCPRCHGQYGSGADTRCSDCPGVVLSPFDADTNAALEVSA